MFAALHCFTLGDSGSPLRHFSRPMFRYPRVASMFAVAPIAPPWADMSSPLRGFLFNDVSLPRGCRCFLRSHCSTLGYTAPLRGFRFTLGHPNRFVRESRSGRQRTPQRGGFITAQGGANVSETIVAQPSVARAELTVNPKGVAQSSMRQVFSPTRIVHQIQSRVVCTRAEFILECHFLVML